MSLTKLRVASVVAVIVNRSGLEECPLCAQGSEALRPKGADDWIRLKADYRQE